MGEPDDPSLPSVKSKAAPAFDLRRKIDKSPTLPVHNGQTNRSNTGEKSTADNSGNVNGNVNANRDGTVNTADNGDAPSSVKSTKLPLWSPVRIKAGSLRFLTHTKNALTHSWINLLLVFVPLGIAVKIAGLKAEIVFSMNAVAIIPLAGLLAHATEVLAGKVGDALGALLNVSFGNAVELILFIILLASGQIEVVQASLLGSILANLLLILGMAFLLGGLKYQEQVRSSSSNRFSAADST